MICLPHHFSIALIDYAMCYIISYHSTLSHIASYCLIPLSYMAMGVMFYA